MRDGKPRLLNRRFWLSESARSAGSPSLDSQETIGEGTAGVNESTRECPGGGERDIQKRMETYRDMHDGREEATLTLTVTRSYGLAPPQRPLLTLPYRFTSVSQMFTNMSHRVITTWYCPSSLARQPATAGGYQVCASQVGGFDANYSFLGEFGITSQCTLLHCIRNPSFGAPAVTYCAESASESMSGQTNNIQTPPSLAYLLIDATHAVNADALNTDMLSSQGVCSLAGATCGVLNSQPTERYVDRHS